MVGVFYNIAVILTTFTMVLDVQVTKSLIEKRFIVRGLATWTMSRAGQKPRTVEDNESALPGS